MKPVLYRSIVRNSFILLITGLALVLHAAPARGEQPIPKPVELWPKGAPGATGESDEDRPAIYSFLPDAATNTGAAILVCPGGGFSTRCADNEGVLVARWLNAHGIAAFVLRYRIRPLYDPKVSAMDANRAMRYLRGHAEELKIAPNRIGIMGFSAGSELACMVAFNPLAGQADAADPLDRLPSQPNFQVLAYGSSTLPAASANRAAGQLIAPPTFMFCTAQDTSHLRGMVDLYAALRAAGVPVEVHFYEEGEHGVGLALGDPVLGTWPDVMFNWVRASGFLTGQPRLTVKGVVTLDDVPLPRGYVIFTPLDSIGAPPATAYVTNIGTGTPGQYSISKNQGLIPGKYRVEVRQDATRWLSNSRNPVMLEFARKQRAGTATEEDRRAYLEYGRTRDLSPSIDELRIFRQAKPGGEDMVVEIKPGTDAAVNISVSSK